MNIFLKRFVQVIILTVILSTFFTLNSAFSTGQAVKENEIEYPRSCVFLGTGKINTTINDRGVFGNPCGNSEYGWTADRFECPVGSNIEYLYNGGFMMGGVIGNDTIVSATEGIVTFSTPEIQPENGQPSITGFLYNSDMSVRAKMNDTLGYDPDRYWDKRLFISISNRAHIYKTTPFNKTIVFDMVVTNIGDKIINEGYIGFYFDTDVYFNDGITQTPGYEDDLAGSIREKGIFYAIDNDGDPVNSAFTDKSPTQLFALEFLNTSFKAVDTNFNWWSNGLNLHDNLSGPRKKFDRLDTVITVDGDTIVDSILYGYEYLSSLDADRYRLLSIKEYDYDQVNTAVIKPDDPVWKYPNALAARDAVTGKDSRFIVSVGPFTLYPDSSIRLQYALFTAELVHWEPNNYSNYIDKKYIPDYYLYNINFSDVYNISFWSHYLAEYLTDPLLDPIGLDVVVESSDSVVVEWDPWVFDGLTSYDVYLYEIPSEDLPYPGVFAPWLIAENLQFYAKSDKQYQFTFNELHKNKFYFISLKHNTTDGVSGFSDTVLANTGGNYQSPAFDRYVMGVFPAENPKITWAEKSGENLSHFNIYKFADSSEIKRKYHKFYDRGEMLGEFTPKDTFIIEPDTFYYYAMEPYARVDSGVLFFEDINFDVFGVYFITSVNKDGFESEFSSELSVIETSGSYRDILVLTNSGTLASNFVRFDSVKSFYDSILFNITPGYSYGIYNYNDSVTKGVILDWQKMIDYKMVVIDDGLEEFSILGVRNPAKLTDFDKYLQLGGKLVYFGGLKGFTKMHMRPDSGSFDVDHWFLDRYFAVDSVYTVGIAFFQDHPLNIIDTLFGFTNAMSVIPSVHDVNYDTSRDTFYKINTFWDITQTCPSVTSFKITNDAELLYTYGSKYPATSKLHGEPVGIRTLRNNAETFLFGFHLWPMKPEDSRTLIDNIFNIINNKSGNEINNTYMSELIILIDYLYRGAPYDDKIKGMDFDRNNAVDVLDLIHLIEKTF